MTRSKQVRKSLNLSRGDLEALAPFLEEGTPEREALTSIVGEESMPYSESAAITALARIGARTVRDALLDRGYRQLAKGREADDEVYDRWALERTEESWAAEE